MDIGAERDVIGAEKGTRKIAVEVKTFAGRSELTDLHNAVGQFIVYKTMLSELEPEREVYLAVSEAVYEDVFTRDVGALMLRKRDSSACSPLTRRKRKSCDGCHNGTPNDKQLPDRP